MLVSGYGYSVQYSGKDNREMVIVKWTWKCVKATAHWFWVGFEIQGYIMAMGYLPPDDTQKLVEEFQLSHSS